jgi:transposase-like protein
MLNGTDKRRLAKRAQRPISKRLTPVQREAIARAIARDEATPAELAEKYGVSKVTIYKWIKAAAT